MMEAEVQIDDHAEQWWQPQTLLAELLLKNESLHESRKEVQTDSEN